MPKITLLVTCLAIVTIWVSSGGLCKVLYLMGHTTPNPHHPAHSFSKYVWNIYHVLGSVLGAKDTVMSKMHLVLSH